MASINQIKLLGKLMSDVELRFTPLGQAIANFTISVENEKLESNSYFSESIYEIKVLAWGELANLCSQLLKKDHLIFLEGHLQTQKVSQKEIFEDDEFGKYETEYTGYLANVIARKIKILENKVINIEENVKEKILKAIQLLEISANSMYSDSTSLQALDILRKIDLDNIE